MKRIWKRTIIYRIAHYYDIRKQIVNAEINCAIIHNDPRPCLECKYVGEVSRKIRQKKIDLLNEAAKLNIPYFVEKIVNKAIKSYAKEAWNGYVSLPWVNAKNDPEFSQKMALRKCTLN